MTKEDHLFNKGIIAFNKRQFYDRILTPMKGMGMIDYDLYKKRYRISDRFSKALTKVGALWSSEVSKISTFKDSIKTAP